MQWLKLVQDDLHILSKDLADRIAIWRLSVDTNRDEGVTALSKAESRRTTSDFVDDRMT
jgi:hypothetical protein